MCQYFDSIQFSYFKNISWVEICQVHVNIITQFKAHISFEKRVRRVLYYTTTVIEPFQHSQPASSTMKVRNFNFFQGSSFLIHVLLMGLKSYQYYKVWRFDEFFDYFCGVLQENWMRFVFLLLTYFWHSLPLKLERWYVKRVVISRF